MIFLVHMQEYFNYGNYQVCTFMANQESHGIVSILFFQTWEVTKFQCVSWKVMENDGKMIFENKFGTKYPTPPPTKISFSKYFENKYLNINFRSWKTFKSHGKGLEKVMDVFFFSLKQYKPWITHPPPLPPPPFPTQKYDRRSHSLEQSTNSQNLLHGYIGYSFLEQNTLQ